SLAVSTAAGEFDQFLDSARTIARDLDGATLAFTPDAYGDGTEIRVLAGGPNSPPSRTTLPVLHARATIEEVETLGKAPFVFIVHASGLLSGRPGYRVGDTATNDVGCPASGAFHFVFKAAGASADRYVPCRTTLSGGPVTLMTWPLVPPAASPTPCSGAGCTATALPTMPASTASCPPAFVEVAGGCTPVSGAGAHYHVTIAGAPATIAVGAAGSFTAQATLTNANTAPPGTPGSIPVGIQSANAACRATPSGWQPSGSSFTVTGAAAGTCAVIVGADTSGVPGSTTDTATVSVTITAASNPTPTPPSPQCDLVANGKCYHRIVDETSQTFFKYVLPNSQCVPDVCWYVDSVKQVILEPTYAVAPPVPPRTQEHELLFMIRAIHGVTAECQPFSAFASTPGNDQIQWGGSVIGGPAISPLGLGEPSQFLTVNHFLLGSTATGSLLESAGPWGPGTTLEEVRQAVANRVIGSPFTPTYSSADATDTTYVQWYPDFPGCDVAGDPSTAGPLYGISGVELTFEVYQAQ
ncbi:MAG: hypothetical protein QOF71_237, partial [Candidatus Eremiobacteraeota bacterium]|nr:hypothetical protein [Candidatus Eremiobacteraeota bacterium]